MFFAFLTTSCLAGKAATKPAVSMKETDDKKRKLDRSSKEKARDSEKTAKGRSTREAKGSKSKQQVDASKKDRKTKVG